MFMRKIGITEKNVWIFNKFLILGCVTHFCMPSDPFRDPIVILSAFISFFNSHSQRLANNWNAFLTLISIFIKIPIKFLYLVDNLCISWSLNPKSQMKVSVCCRLSVTTLTGDIVNCRTLPPRYNDFWDGLAMLIFWEVPFIFIFRKSDCSSNKVLRNIINFCPVQNAIYWYEEKH